ncbi:MAG: SPOR domain-containing protein [Fibrobacteria bacterium]|nr:SPOR domain-containing protein [Fibrobacteria bacterium]
MQQILPKTNYTGNIFLNSLLRFCALFAGLFLFSCAYNHRQAASPTPSPQPASIITKSSPTVTQTFPKPKPHIIERQEPTKSNPLPLPKKQFSEATALDSALDRHPIVIDASFYQRDPNTEKQSAPNLNTNLKTKEQSSYQIQLLTVADFETAQNKRYSLSRMLGSHIRILFDAPFYKLRYGKFTSKKEAQEKLIDIREMGIQGFLVKE